jgi:TonB family protein
MLEGDYIISAYQCSEIVWNEELQEHLYESEIDNEGIITVIENGSNELEIHLSDKMLNKESYITINSKDYKSVPMLTFTDDIEFAELESFRTNIFDIDDIDDIYIDFDSIWIIDYMDYMDYIYTEIEAWAWEWEEEVEEEEVEEEAIPFQMVSEQPTFMGKDAKEFGKWVGSKIQYPEIARENNVQGRVILQVTIEKDGSLTNIKVVRGVDPALDKEALRVVSSSPKWKPGMMRDKAVRVNYTFPVDFKLRN